MKNQKGELISAVIITSFLLINFSTISLSNAISSPIGNNSATSTQSYADFANFRNSLKDVEENSLNKVYGLCRRNSFRR